VLTFTGVRVVLAEVLLAGRMGSLVTFALGMCAPLVCAGQCVVLIDV